MSRNWKRTLAVLVVVGAVGAVAFWYFTSRHRDRDQADSQLLRLYGNVDIRQVELGFRVSGRLKTMAFDEGQSVKAGEQLAALDDQPLQDEVRLDQSCLLLLYGSALFFLAAVVGIGLFISSLCATQQQAILGTFLFMAPATLLSGFATPIANMPVWLQPVTLLDPLRYFLVVTRGVFLKALPFAEVVRNTVPLFLIATGTLTAAAWLFRRRTE